MIRARFCTVLNKILGEHVPSSSSLKTVIVIVTSTSAHEILREVALAHGGPAVVILIFPWHRVRAFLDLIILLSLLTEEEILDTCRVSVLFCFLSNFITIELGGCSHFSMCLFVYLLWNDLLELTRVECVLLDTG